MYRFFGHEPNLTFLSWDKWCDYVKDERQSNVSFYHIARSGYYSIENAQRLIGYQPKYTALEVVEASIQSYLDRKVISVQNKDGH